MAGTADTTQNLSSPELTLREQPFQSSPSLRDKARHRNICIFNVVSNLGKRGMTQLYPFFLSQSYTQDKMYSTWNCRHIFKVTSYHCPRLPSSLPACSIPKPSGWKVTLVNHTTSSACVKHRVSFSHIARHTGHMAHFLVQNQHLLEAELPSSGFLVSVLKKAGNPLLRLETYCSFSLIALPVYTS